MTMQLQDFQKDVDRWITENGGYYPVAANLLRLVEEVGELSRAINQTHGPKRRKEGEAEVEAAEELGDVLFMVACLANQLDLDLQELARATLAKMAARTNPRP